MSDFEVFERGRHRNPRRVAPFVTIYRGVRINFSKPLAEFLKDSPCVLYLIDRERELFALKPCGEDENGYRVRNSGSQAYVSAQNALTFMGLKNALRIPAVIEDGMIQFSYATPQEKAADSF